MCRRSCRSSCFRNPRYGERSSVWIAHSYVVSLVGTWTIGGTEGAGNMLLGKKIKEKRKKENVIEKGRKRRNQWRTES
jgi:hypothetical protein